MCYYSDYLNYGNMVLKLVMQSKAKMKSTEDNSGQASINFLPHSI